MKVVDAQYVQVTKELSKAKDKAATMPTMLRFAGTATDVNSRTSMAASLRRQVEYALGSFPGGDRELASAITKSRALALRLESSIDKTFTKTIRYGPQRTEGQVELAWRLHAAISGAHQRAHVLTFGDELAKSEEPRVEARPRFGREKLPLLVLALAVGILPALHRDRYMEEFQAELGDHETWYRRLNYAVQVAKNAWSLRSSLSEMPKRIPAGSGGDQE